MISMIILYFGFGRTVLLVCPFINAYKLTRLLMIQLRIINSMSIAVIRDGKWIGTILNDRSHVLHYLNNCLQKAKCNTCK